MFSRLSHGIQDSCIAMNEKTYRTGRVLAWSCYLSSWALLVLWMAMAINCRLGLGHWPKPMLENYSSTSYQWLEATAFIVGWFAAIAAGPVCLVTLIIGCRQKSMRGNLWRVALYGLGWVCLVCAMRFDPTTFSDWWFD